MAHLTYVTDEGEHKLRLGEGIAVGRSVDNDLTLERDDSVSREHAAIRRSGGGYVVEDLGSQNGTYLERSGRRMRVTAPTELVDGDTIAIGDARLVYSAVETDNRADTQVVDQAVTQVLEGTRVGRVLPAVPPESTPATDGGRSGSRMLLLGASAFVGAAGAVLLAILLASLL